MRITERALTKRINRALAHEGEKLRKCSATSKWHHDLGDYYTVDMRLNAILHKRVDPVVLGHELGVLEPEETM